MVETVDCEGANTGSYVSLALDGADHAQIAYHSYAFDALKAAQWDGTQWQITTVETGQSGYSSMVGEHNSLVVDGAGRPHILYSESGSVAEPYRLKQASWDGTQWQIAVVEVGGCCYENSAALDSAGHVHVVYQTYAGNDAVIKHAHWDGSQWQFETAVTQSNYWPYGLSMALDGTDRVHLSYYHRVDAAMDLRYAHWDGAAWQFATVEHILSGINYDEVSSLALSGSGQPQVLYLLAGDDLVKHARWDSAALRQDSGQAWQITSVDQGADPGRGSSLVLDGAGRPRIGYIDKQLNQFKYATWDGLAWQLQVVDQGTAMDYTDHTSLVLDPTTGYPRLAYGYRTGAGSALRYAAWDGTALRQGSGPAWQITDVDASGENPSLVLDALGRPHIAYRTNGALRYASWDGAQWVIDTVEGSGVGWFIQLRLDSLGRPHIAYDTTSLDIRYAVWDGAALQQGSGQAWQIQTVASAGDLWGPSLALDALDRPHIAYYDQTHGDLLYARWDGAALQQGSGQAWQFTTVDSAGQVGIYPSLALDAAGNPHISYYDSDNKALKYARWDGTQWLVETVETGNVGWYTSLVLDGNDYPHITHYDSALKDLRYTWFGP